MLVLFIGLFIGLYYGREFLTTV